MGRQMGAHKRLIMTSETYFAEIDGIEYQVEIISDSKVVINGKPHAIDYEPLKAGSLKRA